MESVHVNLHTELDKLTLKNAVCYYEQLLTENNLITEQSSSVISDESVLLANQLFEYTLKNLIGGEKQFVTVKELVMNEECDNSNSQQVNDKQSDSENNFTEINEDEPNYEPENNKSKEMQFIPIDYKIKVVNTANSHPNWSLKTLHKNGCQRLKKKADLQVWKQHIKSGGTIFDKYSIIDSWTHDRFREARQVNQQVTTRNLQQWSLSAASQFPNFEFKASNSWVEKFKRIHRVRQRKITKYVSEKETASMEEILASAENFRLQARNLIINFDPNYVINTDQTGISN